MDEELIEEESPTPEKEKKSINQIAIFFLLVYVVGIALGLYKVIKVGSGGEKPEPDAATTTNISSKAPAIAVIPVYGVITVAEQGKLLGTFSTDPLAKRLKALSEKKDIAAVVLRVNSPGGSVGAVQEIYDEILRLKNAGKKVVVSMGDVAASGGYYIAAAADKIVANPGSLTGSIGVIFQVGNYQELFKKIGLKVDAIKSSKHKDIGSPYRTMTVEEKEILQGIIDDAYQQFVSAIAMGRKMDKKKVLKLADGRIYTGAQAKKAGLVDELGNLETAIAKAAELADIKEKPRIIYEKDSWDKLISIFSRQSDLDLWHSTLSKFGVRFAYIWEFSL